MPDQFKKGTIGAARDNLSPVANRTRFVNQGGESSTRHTPRFGTFETCRPAPRTSVNRGRPEV